MNILTVVVLALAGIGLIGLSGKSEGEAGFPYSPVEYEESRNIYGLLLILALLIIAIHYLTKR